MPGYTEKPLSGLFCTPSPLMFTGEHNLRVSNYLHRTCYPSEINKEHVKLFVTVKNII